MLFLGGDTEWKLSPMATELAREAKMRGKWVHMGRVNSRRRFRLAIEMGCDSADGSHVIFSPKKNVSQLTDWLSNPLLWETVRQT